MAMAVSRHEERKGGSQQMQLPGGLSLTPDTKACRDLFCSGGMCVSSKETDQKKACKVAKEIQVGEDSHQEVSSWFCRAGKFCEEMGLH